MAVYKVPQDVEADDKLIGPFSFRQFVYLIIVVLAIALGWGLSQLFIPLAIIPSPIILLFGALALPLRKDQPMEIYLAAIVSFFLKPHQRLWDPDGIDSLIEITAPKMIEVQRTKDISQGEAQRRFSYLAEIIDTKGWAVRGPGVQAPNSSLTNDVYFAAQQVEDVMDNDNTTAQSFSAKLDQSDARRRQEVVNMMHDQKASTGSGYFNGTVSEPATAPEPEVVEQLEYNPYPENMQQTVIRPIGELKPADVHTTKPVEKSTTTTSEKPLSAAIINLASNADLSIETIAREANRINKQDEVFISLR